MAEPTEADRERAEGIWAAWIASCAAMDDLIAAALADERERARAPFLALAAEWEDDARTMGYTDTAAARIRRAAEGAGQ